MKNLVSGRNVPGLCRAWAMVALFLVCLPVPFALAAPAKLPAPHSGLARVDSRLESFLKAPLSFEPNVGQSDPGVRFITRGSGYGVFLSPDSASLLLTRSGVTSSAVRLQFAGANPNVQMDAASPVQGYSNYLIGQDPSQWRTHVPHFAQVRYSQLYPGVDAVFYGNQRKLEYDLVVAPGTDPSVITLNLAGADSVRLTADGALAMTVNGREVRLEAPVAYQFAQQPNGAHHNSALENTGSSNLAQRVAVASHYQLTGSQVRFALGSYDRSRQVVIDPVLSYASYLGGSGDETSPRVAVDSTAVNLYVAGSTTSAVMNPAPTPGVVQGSLLGTQNIFITKFDTSGTGVFFSTYLGSSGSDTLAGLAVDAAFNIYLSGTTTGANFPITSTTAYQTAPKAPGTHIFVSQLKADGTSLLYSTYLGGSLEDDAAGLAIDTFGAAYVVGRTVSTDFPVTGNVFQSTLPGNSGFVVAKIDTTKSGLASGVYVTYFGGSIPAGCVHEDGAIAVDATLFAYVAGTTTCTNFTPVNAVQPALAGGRDAVVARFNTGGGGTASLTYFGGTGDDSGTAIAVDSSSNVYLAGETGSTDLPKPISTLYPQAQPALGDGTCTTTLDLCGDAYYAKFTFPSSSLVTLIYSTYLGGHGPDVPLALAVDVNQNVFLAGTTSAADFPQSSGFGFNYAGGKDAFLARYDNNGVRQYAALYGGSGDDRGTGVTVDANNVVYFTGDTTSTNLPTQGPLQPANGGGSDAFIAKVGGTSDLALSAKVSANPIGIGNDASFIYTVSNNGPESAINPIFTENVPTSGATFKSITTGQGSCTTTVISNTISCNLGVIAPTKTVTVTVVLTPLAAGSFSNSGLVSALAPAVDPNLANNSAVATTTVVDFYVTTQQPLSQTVASGTSVAWQVMVGPGTPTVPAISFPNNISLTSSISPSTATIACSFQNTPITAPIVGAVTRQLTCATQTRTTTVASLDRNPGGNRSGELLAAVWMPLTGLGFVFAGLGVASRRRRLALFGFIATMMLMIMMLAACGGSKTTTTVVGTPAGTYTLTITGASSGVSRTSTTIATLVVQ